MKQQPIRILLVDDDALVREGVEAILGMEPTFVVVGSGGHTSGTMRQIEVTQPDIVLVDAYSWRGDSLASLSIIRTISPKSIICVLTDEIEEERLHLLYALGVTACIAKGTRPADLILSLQLLSPASFV
ncbi:MAG TPA: response regulator [Anaerolineae bacterium]|nr:response regulator [Anaerolineae bacterium]